MRKSTTRMTQEAQIETGLATEYIPPSVGDHHATLLSGDSYSHYSSPPATITLNTPANPGTPVVLGVDEAGRGPVIGPMVYGIFYLPIELQHSLLTNTYHFDDSKVLTPLVRARLMRTLCTTTSDLFANCGWAIRSLSARDIGAGMLKAGGAYNLNAQAMDATVDLIRNVIDQGVNVAEVYVDTIGQPVVYQRKLAAIFPTVKVTVEKKADSLFPCVSAASVVAKVTRDVSCEVMYSAISAGRETEFEQDGIMALEEVGWGSGYPSDAKCVSWLKSNVNDMFGWGPECRFSWGTLKDLMDDKARSKQVDWPDDDQDNNKLSQYFGVGAAGTDVKSEEQELRLWYGNSVGREMIF